MIARTRLLDQLNSRDSHRWLIEAGAGCGKTVLVDQVEVLRSGQTLRIRRHGRGDRLAFLEEVGAASRSNESPTEWSAISTASQQGAAIKIVDCHETWIVDDVDSWQLEAVELLCRMAELVSTTTTVILTGRVLPSAIDRLRPGAKILGFSDLAFTAEEIESALATHKLAAASIQAVHDLSDGWPVLVTSIDSRLGTNSATGVSGILATHEQLIDGLLHPYVRALDGSDLAVAVASARLPFLDDEIAEMLGAPGVMERIKAAGLPLVHRVDGWIEFPPFVRRSLERAEQDSPKIPPSVIEYFVSRGEIIAAIRSCLAIGELSDAAELIAGVSFSQQTRLEPAALGAAMTIIGEVADLRPRSLLVQAQVNASYGFVPEGMTYLERALKSAEMNDPDLGQADTLEIVLEMSLWKVLHGDPVAAQHLLDRCTPKISMQDRGLLQARIHEIRGLISRTGGSRSDQEIAVREQLQALAIWRQLSEPRPAAVTVFRLVSGPLSALGRRTEAMQLLEDLPSIGPMTLINHARVALEKAVLLPYLGRWDEVPVLADDTRELAATLGQEWLASWALWVEIVATSFEPGREQRVLNLVEEFVHDEHFVLNDFTQYLAWNEITEALARCELYDEAHIAFKRAESFDGPEIFRKMSRLSLQARSGDPTEALAAIGALRSGDDLEHERMWALELFEALCYWRLGDVLVARVRLQASRDHAALLGQVSLPAIVEQRVVERLESSTPTQRDRAQSTISITLFGDFAIHIDGERRRTSKGHATTLIKLVAVSDGKLLIDQVIDALWPEADLALGRRRLRNVIARIRRNYGDLIVRDGDLVRLGTGATTDLVQAQERALHALNQAADKERLVSAVTQNDHDLLPENRYDDWAEHARARHQRLLLRLLDQLARVAQACDDIDTAAHALDRAAELAPHESLRTGAAEILRRCAGPT